MNLKEIVGKLTNLYTSYMGGGVDSLEIRVRNSMLSLGFEKKITEEVVKEVKNSVKLLVIATDEKIKEYRAMYFSLNKKLGEEFENACVPSNEKYNLGLVDSKKSRIEIYKIRDAHEIQKCNIGDCIILYDIKLLGEALRRGCKIYKILLNSRKNRVRSRDTIIKLILEYSGFGVHHEEYITLFNLEDALKVFSAMSKSDFEMAFKRAGDFNVAIPKGIDIDIVLKMLKTLTTASSSLTRKERISVSVNASRISKAAYGSGINETTFKEVLYGIRNFLDNIPQVLNDTISKI